MTRKGSLIVLCLLSLVCCRRGQQVPLEKLTIVEPLNQSPYTVEIGGEVRIKCVATGFQSMIMAHWEKMPRPGHVVSITNMYNPTPEDSDKYEVAHGSSLGDDYIDIFYLTIKDISYEDEGGYNCYTFYGGKKVHTSLLLKVDGPPIVRVIERFINVQEGQNVNISCHYLAKPIPYNSSYWAKNGQNLATINSNKYKTWMRTIPGVMMGYGEFTLGIDSVTMDDSGNYTCFVINYFGQAFGTVELQVSEGSSSDKTVVPGPKSLSIVKLQPASHTWTADANTEIKIVCKADVTSHIHEMTWLFFGLDSSDKTFTSDEERMLNDVTVKTYSTRNMTGCFYTLYIDRLHFSNSGTFVCKVMEANTTEIAVDYFNLTVTGVPVVQSVDFVLNATLGSTVMMTCHIWSYPLPHYTVWKLEDKLLSSNSRYKTSITTLNPIEQEATLTITSVTQADFGVYACNVYNTKGTAMAIHIIQDVDECSYDPPCNQECHNDLGTFQCICLDGYTFANGSTTYCEDIDECMKPGTQACSQICTNLNGTFQCSCKDGYTLDSNNYDCRDNNRPINPDNSGEETDELHMEITPETLYAVVGVCAGGLLAIVLLILTAVYCRRRKWREEELGREKVFSNNVAYESSLDSNNFKSYLANLKSVSMKDEFPRQRLQLGIDLGQGRFGKVMMARALNISGSANWEMVAVKTCRDSASDCEKEDLIQELDIMRKIPKHNNIVAYLGCCTKQDPVYILMEYVKGGNLQAYLRKCRPSQQATTSEEVTPPSAKDLKTISLQIARGMSHIHTCGIIHRDLSARNILISPDLNCKVCDFGLSRDVEGCDVYERSSKGPLPIRWMAPESLTDQWFTKKTDVWSYGVLLWEIVTLGATPYPGMAAREVIHDVTMGKWLQKPLHCKQELYLLMTRCWGMEPDSRPMFKEIVCDVESLLSQEAEYIEFNTYEEERYNVLENTSDERV